MTATIEPDMSESDPEAIFPAPGPGSWIRDADHQSTPRSRLMRDMFDEAYTAGFRRGFARYGLPLDRIEGRHVNGWFYFRAVPAGAPDTGKAPPPPVVMRMLCRLVPELRRRARTAEASVAERRWLADAAAWDAERPQWEARVAAILRDDPATLDDATLLARVDDACTTVGAMTERHFELAVLGIGVGRLFVAAASMGIEAADVMPLLKGGAPSAGAPRALLIELAALCAGTTGLTTLAELRGVSERAAALADEYLRRFGAQLLGTDLTAPCLRESADDLVALVRACAPTAPASGSDHASRALSSLPAEARAHVDGLLADARTCYAAMEDNSAMLTRCLGAFRVVLMAFADRCQARGDLAHRDDIVELSGDELRAVIAGAALPDADELARRRVQRAAWVDPPAFLGAVPSAPPDPRSFPPAMGQLAAATGVFLDLKFTAATPTASESATLRVPGHAEVRGLGVVGGTCTGRIVVCSDPAQALARVEPGDILVCPYTSASHNAIFPLLAGVVTQFGGPVGHTAVTARELDIPAVVATGELPVHLDGMVGTLTVTTSA